MAETAPIRALGWKAPDFTLMGVDGKTWTLSDLRGPKGTLVVFIGNHCPYVKAAVSRLVRDAKALEPLGIRSAAICSNDAAQYPEDSFEHMKSFATAHGFPFPYLHDETQEVARAYGAVCTPDSFGFNANLELQYRGRLDAGRKDPPPADARRELYKAMKQVAETGHGPREQSPSVGCSIKWKV
jgi:peroxiredoxin